MIDDDPHPLFVAKAMRTAGGGSSYLRTQPAGASTLPEDYYGLYRQGQRPASITANPLFTQGVIERAPSRARLMACFADLQARVADKVDPNLTLLGASVAGLVDYFETVCGMEHHLAEVFADATANIVRNNNPST